LCSPYDSSPAARGSSDAQCPKDWQVIRTDAGVPGDVVIYIADPRLDDIPASLNLSARLLFRDYYQTTTVRTVYARRDGTNDFVVSFRDKDVQHPGLFLADLVMYQEKAEQSYNPTTETESGIPEPHDNFDPAAVYPVYVQRMFLEITPNNILTSTPYPLSIAEVRLALRDECPAANFLLDDYEYTDKEIFYAIKKAVDYWNETPPDLGAHSYVTFPYRYHWTLAVIGLLLKQVSRYKLRNWLPYQGGNVSVNDASNWKYYHELGKEYWDDYREFVLHKKVELNAMGGFGGMRGRTTGW